MSAFAVPGWAHDTSPHFHRQSCSAQLYHFSPLQDRGLARPAWSSMATPVIP